MLDCASNSSPAGWPRLSTMLRKRSSSNWNSAAPPPRSSISTESRFDAAAQRKPVGQRGVGVVMGEEIQPRLRALVVADVGIERDIARGLAVRVAHDRDGRPERLHQPVLAPVPDFAAPAPGGADVAMQLLVEGGVVPPGFEDADAAGRKSPRRGSRSGVSKAGLTVWMRPAKSAITMPSCVLANTVADRRSCASCRLRSVMS